jgi:hypothetical protein
MNSRRMPGRIGGAPNRVFDKGRLRFDEERRRPAAAAGTGRPGSGFAGKE